MVKVKHLEKIVEAENKGKLHIDSKGRKFFWYCDYRWHRGALVYTDKCKKRHCKYFYKMYY